MDLSILSSGITMSTSEVIDIRAYIDVGDHVQFSKTIAESDVYMFAGITGDLAPVHTNDQYMRASHYGRRIAHGVLIMGFMSTTSSMIVSKVRAPSDVIVPVSLGYDHVRFVQAAFIGDTITVDYTVKEVDVERSRSIGSIVVTNQDGATIAVAQHILKWVRTE